jgi:hypothetical protein
MKNKDRIQKAMTENQQIMYKKVSTRPLEVDISTYSTRQEKVGMKHLKVGVKHSKSVIKKYCHSRML